MLINMSDKPINRLKAVLAEQKKQTNGLLNNLSKTKLQSHVGVPTKYNHLWAIL